ncbi:SDR family oxidoreductase [uncultured Corynebacterium sp.]|uniref:SDR family oxidoreductase n=1 Tax=uncultured Corynebacterium sp. TaxID=159447 RepID=UPI0025E26DDC|nr:SDR family NAD(P)-dependent oxidoreductase [uncultured Corynebacterium sp.]
MNDTSTSSHSTRNAVLAGLAGAAGLLAASTLKGRSPESSSPRTVLVTGAASGFGLEMTKRFIARGDHVIASDLHESPSAELLKLGDRCTYRKLDATSEEDWAAAAAATGAVDVLMLNAGRAVGGAIETVSIDTWKDTLDLNVLGAVRGCRAYVPLLKPGAQIVITSSVAGLVHPVQMSVYNASKAAVLALGETIDFELRGRGITTSVICPQFFKTNLAESLTGEDAEADKLARIIWDMSPLTVDKVADRAMKGIDARRQVVTTDFVGVLGWYSKRLVRPAYLAAMRRSDIVTEWMFAADRKKNAGEKPNAALPAN